MRILIPMYVAWKLQGDDTVHTAEIKPKTLLAWESANPEGNAILALSLGRLSDVVWMLKRQEMALSPKTVEEILAALEELHVHAEALPADPLSPAADSGYQALETGQ